MEDIMKPSAHRQSEANCNLVDQLGDLVRPVETRLELAGRGVRKRRRRLLPESQERPVTDVVRNLAMVLVIVELVDRLSLLEPVTNVSKELFTFFHVPGHGNDPCVARFVGPDRRRFPPIDNVERCVPKGGLVGGVEDKLRPRQPA